MIIYNAMDRVFKVTLDVMHILSSGSAKFFISDKNTSYIEIKIVNSINTLHLSDYQFKAHFTMPNGTLVREYSTVEDTLVIALDDTVKKDVGQYIVQLYVIKGNKTLTLSEFVYQIEDDLKHKTKQEDL